MKRKKRKRKRKKKDRKKHNSGCRREALKEQNAKICHDLSYQQILRGIWPGLKAARFQLRKPG